MAIGKLLLSAEAEGDLDVGCSVRDDVNPGSYCPVQASAGAISKTAAGGEIDIIDPGGFGAGTITKSITIDGEWRPRRNPHDLGLLRESS